MQESEVRYQLSKAETLEVDFSDGQRRQASTPQSIQRLAQFVTEGAEQQQPSCPFQPAGRILFSRMGKVVSTVLFSNPSGECRYFMVQGQGAPRFFPMSYQGADFLQDLRNSQ